MVQYGLVPEAWMTTISREELVTELTRVMLAGFARAALVSEGSLSEYLRQPVTANDLQQAQAAITRALAMVKP